MRRCSSDVTGSSGSPTLRLASGFDEALAQIGQGYYHFEPSLYLRILFGLRLANLVLLGALAMTIHALVNQKYLGHIVVLMAFAFTVAPDLAGIRHHLLIYGTGPGWRYSDMNGFGPFIGPFVWFKLYWAAWALLPARRQCRGRERPVKMIAAELPVCAYMSCAHNRFVRQRAGGV